MQPQVKVDLSGPFFQRDPSKTFAENIRHMLEGVAQEGERIASAAYPVYTGAGRSGVKGRVASLSGRKWYSAAVISETHVYDWPGGGSKQYRGGKTEARHHMFGQAASALRSSRAVLAANLTAGIE